MAVRCALAVACLALCATGCDAVLETGLSAEQADRVVVALDEASIGASKEASEGGEGYDVHVAASDTGHALAVLRAAELPRREDPGIDDLFAEASLVPTITEERARFTAAIAGELARSIETIDGVLDARVHLAVPEARLRAYDAAPEAPRASVLVKRERGAHLDERAVRSLVAFAVPGMRVEDVAVVTIDAAPAQERATLSRLGPIAVGSGSLFTLKAIIAVSLAVHAALAIVVAMLLRNRKKRVGRTQV